MKRPPKEYDKPFGPRICHVHGGVHRNVWDTLRRGRLADVECRDCGSFWTEADPASRIPEQCVRS